MESAVEMLSSPVRGANDYITTHYPVFLLMFTLFLLSSPAELSQEGPTPWCHRSLQAGNSPFLRPSSPFFKSTSIQHAGNITKAAGQSWPRAIMKGGGICGAERRGKSFDLD